MPDINRATAIIAAQLTPVLGPLAATTKAQEIVEALDAAREATPAQGYAQGDVVQLVRGNHAGVLLIVSEAGPFGISAQAPLHEGGLAIVRAPYGDVLHTGGVAPLMPETPAQAPRGATGTIMEAAHGIR